MDIFDRYFPDSYKLGKLHVQLSPDIKIFEILHNCRLLLQHDVWSPYRPRIISSTPVKTVFTIEELAFLATTRREVIITSHSDGISILGNLAEREDLFSYLIRWRVIESVAEDRGLSTAVEWSLQSESESPGNYLLEESHTVMGNRLLCFLARFDAVDNHHFTKLLMKFLDWIAPGEVPMCERKILLAGCEQSTGKSKDD